MVSKVNDYYGYEDIEELSKMCKFSNCTHISEPHCAVIKALSNGTLSEERFTRFFREKNEKEYISRQKNRTKAVEYVKKKDLFRNPFKN